MQTQPRSTSAGPWHSIPVTRQPAFSLVELLVVIAIIISLVSMLLPSLLSARGQARIVVCSSNAANIGRAAAAYSADCNGWLCGSPGTSGSVMFGADPRPAPEEEDIDTDPVQIWDYAGPLAARYMNMSLPANRALRFKPLLDDMFSCPSNGYFAEPFPGPRGSFQRQPMVSYNTFRNFLMWSRTTQDRDPAKPWGVIAPHPEASFDRIGGKTLPPRNYVPRIDRITNPAGKAYLADGNRYTDVSSAPTYDLEWDALDGGAFCNGGPTLREWDGFKFVLSSYHFDKHLGKYAYRHRARGERGMVVNYFDGHCDFITETQSRQPDRWWPKGTKIPFPELNDPARLQVAHRFDSEFNYVVGR